MKLSKTRIGWKRAAAASLSLSLLIGLAACEVGKAIDTSETSENDTAPMEAGERESIFGEGGLTLFGGKKKKTVEEGGGIGVNSFLWRASLDTLAFMPVNSADAFGGVIITDWYTPQDTPTERIKLNVYILSRSLRADGVRVSVFRQAWDPASGWRDQATPAKVGTELEDAILTRARQLRNESLIQ